MLPIDLDPTLDEDEKIYNLRQWCREHLVMMGEGTTREVFLVDDNQVIKIPLTGCVEINVHEAFMYEEDPRNKAECKLISIEGIPCVVMETVHPLPDDFTWDDDFRFDPTESQVGINKSGQIVSYDWGH